MIKKMFVLTLTWVASALFSLADPGPDNPGADQANYHSRHDTAEDARSVPETGSTILLLATALFILSIAQGRREQDTPRRSCVPE